MADAHRHSPSCGVLITRPQAQAATTAALVGALGFAPVVAPLMAIAAIAAALPPASALQAVLVTSGNALAGLPHSWRRRPLLAVGDATARRAAACGFADVRSAAGDAAALAALAMAQFAQEGGPLLLATGAGQGGALAARLRRAGFVVLRREVYAIRPAAALPAAARMALAEGALSAALFYSAEGAELFVRLLKETLPPATVAKVTALALSHATGTALAPLPWRHIRVASHPNQDELLALLR